MSKDKSHKKDKSKKHDLFSLMLEQSEVFRDMVAHFQSAWAPKMFVHMSGEAANTAPASETVIAKKATRAAKSAKKPATKKVAPVSKKAVAAPATKKPAIATKKSAKKAAGAKSSMPVGTKKSTVKTARHPAKKG
jgi:Uncharacterized C-terminal domain of topoisomerase IA